ncbi:PIN domain-containing protein [Rubrivirga litoralis]|uniref:PIN domain-containing protein n=1 Tax=Rubrivirga litoralis TaxID=3075598 RepID=A0ABU3BQ71_9BACT|nr:hypothetical protein [Rubrivirga sp. F394]MDT0631444.1 hypothetical protein [Rubrivirga sp. F394]
MDEIKRRAATSEYARQVREALGVDTSNEATKDLINLALTAASDGTGADAALVRRFARHEGNSSAIVSMIADPEAVPTFSVSMARGPQERKRLELVEVQLRATLERALDDQTSPEVRRLQGRVESARDDILRDVGAQRGEARESFSRIEDKLSALHDAVTSTAGGLVPANGDTGAPDAGEPVAAAEEAFEDGRHVDAARLSHEVLERDGEANAEVLRRAHNVLARVALADPHTSKDALPHLKAVLRYWSGTEEGRLVNRSLVYLLGDDPEAALREAEAALALDPESGPARSARANALSLLGRPDEAAGLYDGETAEELGARSWFLRMAHRYAEARDAARRATDVGAGPELVLPTVVFAESTVLDLAAAYGYGPDGGTDDDRALLEETDALATSALAVLGDQRPSTRADLLLYRATVRDWLGRGGVLEDLQEAVDLEPENDRVIRNLIVKLMETGETVEAADWGRRLLDLDGSVEAVRLAASAALADGRTDKGVRALEAVGSDPESSPEASEAAIQLADAYANALQTTKAEAVLDRVEAADLVPFGVALARARHAMRGGQRARAVAELESVVETSCPEITSANDEPGRRARGRWRGAHLFLSEFLFEDGAFDRVVRLVAPFDDPNDPDRHTLRRAAALLNLGRYGECLGLCEQALAAANDSRLNLEFESVAAAVSVNLEAFVDAVERYDRVLPGHPERTKDLVAYGQALLRLGLPDRALDALRLAEARVANDPYRLAVVGGAYADAGDLGRALDLSYRALELAFDDERFHRQFAGLFLFHGDEIAAAGPLDGKYLDQFHDILHHHAERFPEAEPFVWLEKIPEDPDELAGFMIDLVRPRHEGMRNVRAKLFTGGQAPLGAVASLIGRNVLEAWGATVANPEAGRAAYPGHPTLRERSNEVAERTDVVVADSSALVTLYELGVLREAVATFDEVLVPQAFVDELRHALDKDQPSSDGKKRTMGLGEDGETLVLTETASDVVKRERAHLQGLYDLVTAFPLDPDRRAVRIIGWTPDRERAAAEGRPDEFEDVFGPSAAEAAYEAEARDVPLLSDGMLLRGQAEKVGTATTDSYAVLVRLRETGAVSDSVFDGLLLRLVGWGYRYVSLSSGTLARAIERERGLLTSRSRAPFDYLTREGTTAESAGIVLGSFVVWLWRSELGGPLPTETVRRQWTAVAFETLACISTADQALKVFGRVSGLCINGTLDWRGFRDFKGGLMDAAIELGLEL